MVKDQKTASSSSVKVKKITEVKTNKPSVQHGGQVKVVSKAAPKIAPKNTSRATKVQNGKSIPKGKPVEVKAVGAKSVGVKPEAAKKQEKPSDKNGADDKGEKGKRKLSKKQIGIICGVAAILVVALVVVLVLVFGGKKSATGEVDDVETSQDEAEVDYDQKVTDKDGGKFKAEYQAGSEESFAVRFSNLKCEDGCKNVSEVKLGKKVLKLGEDYEVQRGSIIIILTESLMKGLKEGKHDLIVAVVEDGETKLYGVKFTVKAAPTCAEDEKLEKGECVKKDEEEDEKDKEDEENADESQDVASSQVTPTTPSKSPAEIECENSVGPTGFYAVHWFSETEMTDATFSGEAAAMHRVNGVCRPYMAQMNTWTGRGFAASGWPVAENADPVVLENKGQDIIMWFWGDGSTTVDKVPDARGVWGY